MKAELLNHMTAGVAYYPEHWEKGLWEEDLQRMLALGITLLRIGDFTWSKYEYREGEFTIAYFDEFLDLCKRLGMKVIFCTPTAAPPMWMAYKYPEILNANIQGNRYTGPRRHYNYNSPVYRRLCLRLVQKLADHYGMRQEIVAWQIDNELNCDLNEFYSEADHAAYREYLKKKFCTLDALNESLGLTFWNRTYSDWAQVRLCGMNVGGAINPQQALEEKRFFSDSAIAFCTLQTETIRPYLRDGITITTNGLFGNLDYNSLLEKAELDFISYDSYPNFAFELDRAHQANNLLDRKWSWNLTWTRSVSPVFGIMEQQAGANGWSSRMETPAPRPGQMRLWAMQSIAHGANMVSFFRWRTSPIGCEIYWHGLNDYANTPNRRLEELKRFTDGLQKLETLRDTEYLARVAILKDYDNEWDAASDVWHGRIANASDNAWFEATQRTHTPCDFIYLRPDTTAEAWNKYQLLIYPHAAILEGKTSCLLQEYVKNGGILVVGARTGYKDRTGRCPMRPMPGLIDEWCGITVTDYTYASPVEEPSRIAMDGRKIEAAVFYETLRPEASDVVVLGRFSGGYNDDEPALVTRKIGAGMVIYLGTGFSVEMATEILRYTHQSAPFSNIITLPESVELAVRKKEGAAFLFVLNYLPQSAEIELHSPMTELLSGEECRGRRSLPAYGVEVFQTT